MSCSDAQRPAEHALCCTGREVEPDPNLPATLCEKADYMNINSNSQKSKCDCSGRGAPNTDEEGEAREIDY